MERPLSRPLRVVSVSKTERAQMACELMSFCVMVVLTFGQLAVLDHLIVNKLNDDRWWSLIVLDVGVVACLFWLLALAVRYQRTCTRSLCQDDSNIRYAFIGWLAYSLVLAVKICIIFKLVVQHLKRADFFGPGALEMTLSASALIFLLLVLSHHFNDPESHRQMFLSYLASTVTLDVIDSVVFLKLLLDARYASHMNDHPTLSTVVLFLSCFNFILPTFSLFKLRYNIGILPRWLPLPYETVYSLFYLVAVNLPFLVIRLFVWTDVENSITAGSVFLVKNVVMIIVGIRELWIGWMARHRCNV